jgi:hypothetical protein
MKAPGLRQACCDLETSLRTVQQALASHYTLCARVAALLDLEGCDLNPKKRAALETLAAALEAFDAAPASVTADAAGNAAREARWAAAAWDRAD